MAQDLLTDAFVRLRQKLKAFSGHFTATKGAAAVRMQLSRDYLELMRRYFEAETTAAEERALARYAAGSQKDACIRYAYGVPDEDETRGMAGVEDTLADFFGQASPAETNLKEMFQR